LIERLLERNHCVHALVRRGSEGKLPAGATPVTGDALDASTFADRVPFGSTYVQLVGVPKPNPSKARQFREIDLASALASVEAARAARVEHFVYVSVAQPAPVMRAYVAARQEVEAAIRESALNATFLRPWYILGPGHYWPYVLLPIYALLERIPATREQALRLGLVTHAQMLNALVQAIDAPPQSMRILNVSDIRRLKLGK
jgi:uncharacterized protein YbjT (DUF2867 family)